MRWMLALTTAAALALSTGSAVAGPARPDGTGGTAAAAPPSQMHQLDFLLGTWRCTFTTPDPNGPAVTGEVVSTIRPTLGGQWYEWNALTVPTRTAPVPKASRWLFGGWNPADSTFTALYLDDRGKHGVQSSPGLRDGHVVFRGTFTTPDGSPAAFVDDFTSQGRAGFTDTVSVESNGTVTQRGSVVCRVR